MEKTDGLHRVTGDLSPDGTGDYLPDGLHNGIISYAREDDGWFIWNNGIDTWVISEIKGNPGARHWDREDPSQEGIYEFKGTATGDATVTEI